MQWRLRTPRLAVQETLDAAAELDEPTSELSEEELATLHDIKVNGDRSKQRSEHLDHMEQGLRAA